jgi:hypothetical protein
VPAHSTSSYCCCVGWIKSSVTHLSKRWFRLFCSALVFFMDHYPSAGSGSFGYPFYRRQCWVACISAISVKMKPDLKRPPIPGSNFFLLFLIEGSTQRVGK